MDLINMRLDDIKGLHPEIEKILTESGSGELPRPYVPSISLHDITIYSSRSPIILHQYKNNFYVISNLDLYTSATSFLQKHDQIPVFIHKTRMSKPVRDIIRDELLIKPAIYARAYDPGYLYRIHKWMSSSKKYFGLRDVPLSKSEFAKWIHTDVRNIK